MVAAGPIQPNMPALSASPQRMSEAMKPPMPSKIIALRPR